MFSARFPVLSDDLRLRIGDRTAKLSPTEGLRLSEDLARRSFRALLAEEADAFTRRTAAARTPARRGKRVP